VADRYWSPDEVEALIPALTEIMEAVMQANSAATGARERLEEQKHRIVMAGGGVIDQAAWRADTRTLEAVSAEVRNGLERIVGLGGVPKDLSLGLVDFLHLREGREVNLCWKYGERRITFWHGLDEGYAGRKPLGSRGA
jgi:hypothetical protein